MESKTKHYTIFSVSVSISISIIISLTGVEVGQMIYEANDLLELILLANLCPLIKIKVLPSTAKQVNNKITASMFLIYQIGFKS